MFALYRQAEYARALGLAQEAQDRFPEHASTTWFWVASLQARDDRHEEALATIQETVRRDLLWRLRWYQDHDLDPIRDRPEFVAAMKAAEDRVRAFNARPEVIFWQPQKTTKIPPLVLGLHGANGTAAHFGSYLQSLATCGFLVACGQSSQPCSPTRYCWDDPDQAERDLEFFYRHIRESHPFDASRVILAGFSQGGAIAISAAVRQRPFSVAAFVGVCPSISDVGRFRQLVESGPRRNLRGWSVIGTNDPWRTRAEDLHREMEAAGMHVSLEVEPGLGHEVPPDLEARLRCRLPELLPGS